MPIAKVRVDVAVDREFDYRIPPELEGSVRLGSRVAVPFGPNMREGFVVGFVESSSFARIRDIASILDSKPILDDRLIALAKWMADYYCAGTDKAITTVLPSPVRRKGVKHKERFLVSLTPAGVSALADDGVKKTPRQRAMMERLAKDGPVFAADLSAESGMSPAVLGGLIKRGLVQRALGADRRDPQSGRKILPTLPLQLMPEQAEALKEIVAAMDGAESGRRGVVLLQGVTGSGKTEVYLQAIDAVLARGKGAIVLVPEISLTPQTIERFRGRFGEQTALLHSRLSEGERHDEWHRLQEGKARIAVGARSAVFAPVHPLGLIVVDEEHEPSYKQDESPRYNARDVAVMRGAMESCAVVLGSATPSLESLHNARRGRYRIAHLPRRADNRKMPSVRVVDMRIEKGPTGKTTVFSRPLLDAMAGRLERAEQVMLFLNRRGYATSLVCPACGHVAVCPDCSVSMTYHRDEELLRCHLCGGAHAPPRACPACSDPAFRMSGIGTQRVEAVAQKCFPHARVGRLDTDAARRKRSCEDILDAFRAGEIDILVGTQMIAKGLHFPRVTLVGIVCADMGLHMPDFRAGERSFQLMAQVAGRAGRGEALGEVIIQTFTPFHVAVQAARRLDFDGFAEQELEFRKELGYPPYRRIVCVGFRGVSEEVVSFACGSFARALRPLMPEGTVLSDPCPAPLAKIKRQTRYQLIIRCRSVRDTVGAIRKTLAAVKMPKGVSCLVDVDALNLM